MQNIPVGYQPYPSNTVAVPATGGSVNIIINNPSASLNPNGANINNSCSGLPGQAYPPGYYINNNNTNNNIDNNATTNETIPHTGIKDYTMPFILIFLGVAVISYIRYKKIKNI